LFTNISPTSLDFIQRIKHNRLKTDSIFMLIDLGYLRARDVTEISWTGRINLPFRPRHLYGGLERYNLHLIYALPFKLVRRCSL